MKATTRSQVSDGLIYLDNNASGAPDPVVLDAVIGAMRDLYGNPSSQHAEGAGSAQAVEIARAQIADAFGCNPQDIVFTSGATESNNLALIGLWEASTRAKDGRDGIVISATEHPSVIKVAEYLKGRGATVSIVPVGSDGQINLEILESMVDERTLIVSVMLANNETGVVGPVADVVRTSREVGALVHCDAAQAPGRIPVSMSELEVDLMTMSGHKMHGPKGVGLLVATRAVPIACHLHGGGQERGRRSGTLNTPGIVGLGVAAEIAKAAVQKSDEIALLRDRLEAGLRQLIPATTFNGDEGKRLGNTSNARFLDADAEAVMAGMSTIACSSGSACSSSVPTPSPVLISMGADPIAASESIRFSLSRFTTESEIDRAIHIIAESVGYVRRSLGSRVA
jgi:cysteine desulfurase